MSETEAQIAQLRDLMPEIYIERVTEAITEGEVELDENMAALQLYAQESRETLSIFAQFLLNMDDIGLLEDTNIHAFFDEIVAVLTQTHRLLQREPVLLEDTGGTTNPGSLLEDISHALALLDELRPVLQMLAARPQLTRIHGYIQLIIDPPEGGYPGLGIAGLLAFVDRFFDRAESNDDIDAQTVEAMHDTLNRLAEHALRDADLERAKDSVAILASARELLMAVWPGKDPEACEFPSPAFLTRVAGKEGTADGRNSIGL